MPQVIGMVTYAFKPMSDYFRTLELELRDLQKAINPTQGFAALESDPPFPFFP